MAHTFRLWAPDATQVELAADGRRMVMESSDGGWWERRDPDAGPGARYGFSLDGGPLRPDPRSMSQPDGVHGLSEVVDHSRFAWSSENWRGVHLPGSVLYELHVGTFSPEGTFTAAIDHLGHLVDLGVDVVELMPVAEFSGSRGWGYDGVDLFAPHHAYGGPDGLKRFVDACHGAGLGVVMDVVYNHLGPAGNYLSEFGPYFTPSHRTNWGDAVNFDGPGSAEVRRFVVDNALMWLRDYRCDGLRLDAVHAIADDSAFHILEQLSNEVEALSCHTRRPLFLIAENDTNDPRLARDREAGGFGMKAVWADEWHHAVHAALTGERGGYYEDFGPLSMVAKAARQAWVYDGVWSPHRRRVHGRSPAGLSGHQFVISVQNHDQVGNRALGERLSSLTTPGRLKIAAVLMLTGPFTPMLFHGEEWAAASPFQYFTDHEDAGLGKSVSAGRRNEFAAFGWDPAGIPDPQDPDTFTRSKLDWAERNKEEHQEVETWYRALISLRRTHPELSDPRLAEIETSYDEGGGWLIVRRGRLGVAVNLAGVDRVLRVPEGALLLCASSSSVAIRGEGLFLPPDSAAVFEGEDLARDAAP